MLANCISKVNYMQCYSWSKIISKERCSVLRSLNLFSACMISFFFFFMFNLYLMTSCCQTWILLIAISKEECTITYSVYLVFDEEIDLHTANCFFLYLAKDISVDLQNANLFNLIFLNVE